MTNGLKRLLLIVQFFAMLLPATVQAQKTMYRTVGHQTAGSEGRNVVPSNDGGYFLSYYTYYAGKFTGVIAKLNCAGQTEWERFFEEGFHAIPVDVIPIEDNGCLIALSLKLSGGDNQVAVLKLDEQGNTLWTRRLHIRAGVTTGCMGRDTDGSVYVCGSDTNDVTGFAGTTIVKLNRHGDIDWQKEYGEYMHHITGSLAVTSDHRVVVVGQVGIPDFIFTNVFVMAIDRHGNFLGRKVYTTYYDDEPRAVCADNFGNVIVSGYSYFLNSQWDMFFLKVDDQLNVVQSKFYDSGTTQGEQARYVIASDNNTFTLFGDAGGFNERNPAVLKLNAHGDLIWAKQFPVSPSYTNYLFHGAQCDDNGFVMTGDARPVNQFRIAPFIKTDNMGNAGCFTSSLNVSVRTENWSVTDTLLLVTNVTPVSDENSVPGNSLPFLTSNTVFCQNLVPCGNFTFATGSICPELCFTFNETNVLADNWLWTFENGSPALFTGQYPPAVCFSGQGPHEVTLTLSNPVGSVTVTRFIGEVSECPVFIPNVFTPDGDDKNALFMATGVNEPFSLMIFNRWGNEIYHSPLPGNWWNGSSDNGKEATPGIYYYVLKLEQSSRVFTGTVELIR